MRGARSREEHDKDDDVFSIEDEKPGEDTTDNATDVLDKPYSSTLHPAQTHPTHHSPDLPYGYGILIIAVVPMGRLRPSLSL